MSSFSRLLLAALLLSGCDGDHDDATAYDDLEHSLLEEAERLGLSAEDSFFDGEHLVLDDVMLGSEHVHGHEHEHRGYSFGFPVAPGNRAACIVFDNRGPDTPSLGWLITMANAVNEWNAVSGSEVDLKLVLHTSLDDDPSICAGRHRIAFRESDDLPGTTLARASFPFGSGSQRRPGNTILVQPGSAGTNKTAMHEIGHCFGFVHPDDPAGTQIAGTSSQGSNYASVMWSNGNGPAGNDARSTLSFDDARSIRARYGPPAAPPPTNACGFGQQCCEPNPSGGCFLCVPNGGACP